MRLETEPSAVSSLPFLEGLYVCFIRLVVFFDPISKCVNVFVWCDSIGGGLVVSYLTFRTWCDQLTAPHDWESQWPKAEKGQSARETKSAKLCEQAPARCAGVRDTFHQWGKKHTFVCKRTRQVVTQHVQPCTLSHRVQFTSPERRVMQRVLLTHFWVRL